MIEKLKMNQNKHLTVPVESFPSAKEVFDKINEIIDHSNKGEESPQKLEEGR